MWMLNKLRRIFNDVGTTLEFDFLKLQLGPYFLKVCLIPEKVQCSRRECMKVTDSLSMLESKMLLLY